MAKIIIFSGAGISAESGISTFRDSGGLWEQYKIEEICSAGCLSWNYEKTVEFYDKRRIELKDKKPNRAHLKIKELQDNFPKDIKIITQNVDNLFEKAGCKDVLHLHGFLTSIYCENCSFKDDIGYKKLYEVYKECPECGAKLRPDIVFFGETAPKYKDFYEELSDCEMFVAIGSSGNVINTDIIVSSGKIRYSILNILEPSEAINDKLYSKVLYKKATDAIDEIVFDIKKSLIAV